MKRKFCAIFRKKYDYAFSQWDGRDVNALGLFGYTWLEHY